MDGQPSRNMLVCQFLPFSYFSVFLDHDNTVFDAIVWSDASIFSVSFLLNTSGPFAYCFRCSVSGNFSCGKTTQKCESKSLACVTIFICKMIKIVEASARFKTAISAGLWRQWQ